MVLLKNKHNSFFCRNNLLVLMFSFFLFNCGGLNINHYTEKNASKPIDGNLFTKGEFANKPKYYPQGNLEYMTDLTKRDNKVFFASSREYNDLQYNISSDYLNEYDMLLKTNAEELEDEIKKGNFGTTSYKMMEKMEVGEMRKYPLKENIISIQNLYNENEKIAKPLYLKDYLDKYDKQQDLGLNEQKVEIRNNIDEKVEISEKLSKDEKRNKYVQHFLAMSDNL